LVLSRKNAESIVLGLNVVAAIVEVNGDRVWLGIDAPPDMPVTRTPPEDGGAGVGARLTP
jgi:carbon storage regulator CsrA